jgi:hypothetical protein
MSGESAAVVGKDMRAGGIFQRLTEFAASRWETAMLHPTEAAVKLPWPFCRSLGGAAS